MNPIRRPHTGTNHLLKGKPRSDQGASSAITRFLPPLLARYMA